MPLHLPLEPELALELCDFAMRKFEAEYDRSVFGFEDALEEFGFLDVYIVPGLGLEEFLLDKLCLGFELEVRFVRFFEATDDEYATLLERIPLLPRLADLREMTSPRV